MARKDSPKTQRKSRGSMAPRNQIPAAAAIARFARVADVIPRMIGSGRRYRAASMSERSWVLSPISPIATSAAVTKNASTGLSFLGKKWRPNAPPSDQQREDLSLQFDAARKRTLRLPRSL